MALVGANGLSLPTTYSSLSYHFRPKLQFGFNYRALKTSLRFLPSLRAMGSSPSSSSKADDVQEGDKMDSVLISEEEWKKRLTKEQFYITRHKGTERAFTGYDLYCLKQSIFLPSLSLNFGFTFQERFNYCT
ncbi:peptide methionine sulfoxide reductase B1, chloroplastic-like [Telopea speciosissima]|uniref:peptide methionine sulfoxide reductase B1, chloroplastic-like n=1 Tax=Telopea speciosissima TaxID=54955 RepID=UPI001CC7DF1E|nr:peptide methionine sulfoxide reductase B1, chloroplastic-like [Telopea speciosissima]